MDDFLSEMFAGTLIVLSILTVIYIFFSYAIKGKKSFGFISKRWFHLFDTQKMSGDALYSAIEESIQKRKIPDVKINRINYFGTYLWENKREYLRVSRNRQVFLICASPFGKSYFISWWFGEKITFARDFWTRVPFIGKSIARLMLAQNFYQDDSDTMFAEQIKHCVNEVVNKELEAKGLRGLTTEEQEAITVPVKKA